ncbi:MAG TPA: hypothetical protein VGX96_20015 [Candidatus Elarobacter sp.]|jgi:hypothetical protein|nr:hypothetical protein [Candidatus Elarobacter sp.]
MPPPKSIAIPAFTQRGIPSNVVWSSTSAGGWTHLHAAGPADVYLHGGHAYQVVEGASAYGPGEVSPYLLDVTGTFATGARTIRDAAGRLPYPRAGTAVLTERSGAQKTLDIVFADHGVVKLLGDYRGPRALVVYEHDCVACRAEIAQLRALASLARRGSGVLVVATRHRERRVRDDLAKAGIDAPVVSDERGSLYGLLGVKNIPLGYYFARDGSIVDTSLGNLDDSDVGRYGREIAGTTSLAGQS